MELLILFSHSNCFWSPCCGTIAVWGTQNAENRGENEKICACGVHVLKNGADYNEREAECEVVSKKKEMGREGLWESSYSCEEVTEETHGQWDACLSNEETWSGGKEGECRNSQ